MTTQPDPNQGAADDRTFSDLLARQTLVAETLTGVTTLADAAAALSRLTPDVAHMTGLLITVYDEAGHFAGLRRLHHHDDMTHDDTITGLALSQVGDRLRGVAAGIGPVMVDDVAALKPGDSSLQNWLADRDVKQAACLPVRVDDRVAGAVVIGWDEAGHLPDPDTLRVFQALAHQVAIVVRLNYLADEVEASQEERRSLSSARGLHTAASRDLMAARDGLGVLRVLKQHLARDARQLALYSIDWDERTGEATSLVLEHLIAADDVERSPRTEIFDIVAANEKRAMQDDWQRRGQDLDFVEDLAEAVHQRPALMPDYRRGLRSLIAIPVFEEERLVYQLRIAYDAPRIYPDALRRVYDSLRDQITVVMQNHRLLRTTEDSLREARTLYDINRELMSARGSIDVLRVLRTYLASDDATLSLREFEWEPGQSMPTRWALTAVIDGSGEQVMDASMLEHIDPADLTAFKADWGAQGHAVDFIEDMERAAVARPTLNYYLTQGYRSSVVIPVYDRDQLTQQIRVSYQAPRTFSGSTRRLYGAIRDQMTIILQNRRLLALMEAGLREVQRLYDANRDLLRTTTPVDILRVLNERVAPDASQLILVTIGWNDDETAMTSARVTDILTQQGIREVSQDLIAEATRQDLSRLRDHWATLNEGVDFVENVADRLPERPDLAYSHERGAHSAALLPVFRRGHIIHQIMMLFEAPHSFSAADRRLYNAISDQVSVVMQNQRLLASSQRQTRQLQTIADFGQAVQTNLDRQAVIDIALSSLKEMLAPDFAAIYMRDSFGGALKLIARLDGDVQTAGTPGSDSITAAQTTAMHAYDHRLTFHDNDLTRLPDVRPTLRVDLVAVIAVPLIVHGQPAGVIEVGATHRDAFSRPDVAAVQQLTGQMGVALENIDVLARSERSAASKTLVNTISSKLQRQMDMERILDVTINEVGQALGARRARIRFGPAGSASKPQANGHANRQSNGHANGHARRDPLDPTTDEYGDES